MAKTLIGNVKGQKGADGKNGSNGVTPHIGSNGNWYIGTTDTGVAATAGAEAAQAAAAAAENAQSVAATSATTAQNAATQAQECLTEVETKMANGEFDGAPGQRGTGILKVTTAPSGYTTAIGSYTPKYRIALSTVKSQSKVDEVLLGDVIQYSYYQYLVDYLDATYAYTSVTRTSLRGATGAAGTTPVKGTDYWTDADKAEIKAYVDEAILGGAW